MRAAGLNPLGLILGALFLASVVPALSASPEREALDRLIQQREALIAKGNSKEAEAVWEQIVSRKGFLGIPRLEPLGLIEATRGVELARSGDREAALRSLQRALDLDPGLWSVAALQAQVAGIGAPQDAVQSFMRSIAIRLNRPLSRYLFFVNAGLVLAAVFALFPVFVVAAFLIRFGGRLRHDVEEFFGGSFSRELGVFLGFVGLALPLLAWLGFLLSAIIWLAALMVYAKPRERAVAILAIVMAGLFPPVLEFVYAKAVPFVSTPTHDYLEVTAGLSLSASNLTKLQKLLLDVDQLPVKRSLAYLLRDAGQAPESRRLLQDLLKLHPREAAILLDLGNVAFVEGDAAMASHFYNQATQLDPGLAVAYYNMSLAYNKQLRLKDAEAFKAKAERLDPSLIQRASVGTGVSVLDDRPDQGLLFNLLARRIDTAAYAQLGLRPPSAALFFVPSVYFAFLALVLGIVTSLRFEGSFRCQRCQGAYCYRCNPEPERTGYCPVCTNIFVSGTGVSAALKEAKERAIEAWDRRMKLTRRILAFILPGFSHLLTGRIVFGTFVGLTAIFSLSTLLFAGTFLEPWQLQGGGLPVRILLILLLVASSLLSGIGTIRSDGEEFV